MEINYALMPSALRMGFRLLSVCLSGREFPYISCSSLFSLQDIIKKDKRDIVINFSHLDGSIKFYFQALPYPTNDQKFHQCDYECLHSVSPFKFCPHQGQYGYVSAGDLNGLNTAASPQLGHTIFPFPQSSIFDTSSIGISFLSSIL